MKSYENVMMQTLAMSGQKIRQTNSTDASYPSRVTRLAWLAGVDNQPSGIGDAAAQTTMAVKSLKKTDAVPTTNRLDTNIGAIYNVGIFQFFGTGNDDTTFLARILGWRYVTDAPGTPETAIWVPVPLLELTCTLSTATGVAGGTVGSSDRFADTLAIVGTTGNDDVSIDIVSPANNTPAHVVVDLKGFQKVEVIFDRNSSASSCNGLWAFY